MTDLPPRDLPRRAAPLLIGAGDIYIGLARATDPGTKSYGLSHVPGSLTVWGLVFVAGGLLALCGAFYPRILFAAAAFTVPLGLVWWYFLLEARDAYPLHVSRSGPATAIAIASWHILLCPYRRDRRRLDSGPT